MTLRDKTFCINTECPFKDCDRHPILLKGVRTIVSVAPLDGVSDRYIRYLVKEVEYDRTENDNNA